MKQSSGQRGTEHTGGGCKDKSRRCPRLATAVSSVAVSCENDLSVVGPFGAQREIGLVATDIFSGNIKSRQAGGFQGYESNTPRRRDEALTECIGVPKAAEHFSAGAHDADFGDLQ